MPRNEDVPQFKHREVVRKHDEREKLKGFDCKQCAEVSQNKEGAHPFKAYRADGVVITHRVHLTTRRNNLSGVSPAAKVGKLLYRFMQLYLYIKFCRLNRTKIDYFMGIIFHKGVPCVLDL